MTRPLLLSVFPTFAVGGAQTRFATVANHLGRDWRHAIVAMDGVTTARAKLDPALDVAFPPLDIRKGDTVGNVRRFRAALKVLKPTTLLTHNFGSIEWAMANRIGLARHVHVEDGFGPEERDRQMPRRVWLRRLFLRGRTVVLPSQTLMRIAREIWRLDPARTHYLPNGVDMARFSGVAPERPWADGKLVIGTVAALRPEKNIGRLLRAFAAADRACAARLVIIGDGAERGALEREAASLNLDDRASFLGHIAEPASLIRSFDVFALSSDTEQMPLSLLEAMAAGVAVVATDVGDVRTMLPTSQHVAVCERNDAAFANALSGLLAGVDTRIRLGAENRRKVIAEYQQEAMLTQWRLLVSGDDSLY